MDFANYRDADRQSFAESDQFEDDSNGSWCSDSDSQVNNWRGWRKNTNTQAKASKKNVHQPERLLTLSAQSVAAQLPFELVESSEQTVPEELQKLVAFFSFPTREDDIRLYSCLACGSGDEFMKGEQLYRQNAVKECLQIGFHLTAKVVTRGSLSGPANMNASEGTNLSSDLSNTTKLATSYTTYRIPVVPPDSLGSGVTFTGAGNGSSVCKVSLSFDRCHITSCTCSCGGVGGSNGIGGVWCCHVVAVCLFRIHEAPTVLLRAPISESLSKLTKNDLQKFAQNLICQMNATEILPAAQNILDQLLAATDNPLKSARGAPDPTSGGSLEDVAAWCFDVSILKENVRKILQKFCVPQPVVYSDPSYLTSNLPAEAQEYQNLLRPLRAKEPEGIWNLLSIIRDMFRRSDNNAVLLLETLTGCLLEMDMVITWWYSVRLNLPLPGKTAQQQQTHYAAAGFCDEMVQLWRLAALKPSLHYHQQTNENSHQPPNSSRSRRLVELATQMRRFHRLALDQALRGWEKIGSQRGGGTQQSVSVVARSAGTATSSSLWQQQQQQQLQWSAAVGWFSEANQREFKGFKPALEACKFSWQSDCCRSASTSGSSPSRCHHQRRRSGSNPSRRVGLKSSRSSGGSNRGTTGPASLSGGEEGAYEEEGSLDDSVSSPPTDGGASSSSEGAALKAGGSNRKRGKQMNGINIAGVGRIRNGSGPRSVDSKEKEDLDICTLECDDDVETDQLFSNLQLPTNRLEMNYCRCQALYYHGYPREAAALARKLTTQMLDGAEELKASAAAAALLACRQTTAPGTPVPAVQLGASQHGRRERRYRNATTPVTVASNTNGAVQSATPPVAVSNGFATAVAGPANGGDVGAVDFAEQASLLMERALFLTSCLFDDPSPCDTSHETTPPLHPNNMELAFKLCLLALSLPRPPARIRALQVKLFYQEWELLSAVHRLPTATSCPQVIQIVREKAQLLKDGQLPEGYDVHLPYSLASYLFEQLSGGSGGSSSSTVSKGIDHPTATPAPVVLGTSTRHHSWRQAAVHAATVTPSMGWSSTASGVSSCWLSGPPAPALATTVTSPARRAADEELGFEAAVAVLGMRSRLLESNFPLLAEGQRKQRDDLAAHLLYVYKEDIRKLSRILDQLLDRHYNPYFKAPPLYECLTLPVKQLMAYREPPPPPPTQPQIYRQSQLAHQQPAGIIAPSPALVAMATVAQPATAELLASGTTSEASSPEQDEAPPVTATTSLPPSESVTINTGAGQNPSPLPTSNGSGSGANTTPTASPGGASVNPAPTGGARTQRVRFAACKTTMGRGSRDTDSSALEDESETSADTKEWQERFRCATLRSVRRQGQHSVGMAAVDSSAPETTSSDNSPTTVRRNLPPPAGTVPSVAEAVSSASVAPTACGSPVVHQDSDASSVASSDSGERARGGNCSPRQQAAAASVGGSPCSATPAGGGANSYQQRSNATSSNLRPAGSPAAAYPRPVGTTTPTDYPPSYRPTESMAHHMFDLAQTVLQKAGGSHASGSVFVAPFGSNGAHRNLQLAAFEIGLYALGLYNSLNPSWQSRTYSSHVAWVSSQVTENGLIAACVLYHTWKHHLNPAELAAIAYKASRGRDAQMVAMAAELCLACLAECSTLNPNDILRALSQCKEQSPEMLERGLHSVENGANNSLSGVQPEIYFHLAQYWFQLYELELQQNPPSTTAAVLNNGTVGAPHPQQQHHNQSQVAQHALVVAQQGPPTLQQQFVGGFVPFLSQQNYHSVAALRNHHPGLHLAPNQQQLYQHHTPPVQGNGGPPSTSVQALMPHNIPAAAFQHHFTLTQNCHQVYLSASATAAAAALYPSCPTPTPLTAVYISPPPPQTPALRQLGPRFQMLSPPFIYQTGLLPFAYPYPPQPHPNFAPQFLFQSPHSPSTFFNLAPPQALAPPHTAENKANQHLRKAFQCAMRAINVLFKPQAGGTAGNSGESGLRGGGAVTGAGTPGHTVVRGNGGAAAAAAAENRFVANNPASQHDSNIRWTLQVAKLLGPPAVHEYCNLVVQCIQSPFLMKDIAFEVIQFYKPADPLSGNDPLSATTVGGPTAGGVPNPGFVGGPPPVTAAPSGHPPPLGAWNLAAAVATSSNGVDLTNKLVNRVHMLFRKYIEKRLQVIGQAQTEWDDLVDVILNAYKVQTTMPPTDPSLSWQELRQKIQRHPRCTKDLWQRILAGIQTFEMQRQ